MDAFKLSNGENLSCCSIGQFHMTVSDSGAGMTKDQLSHLFEDGVQFNVNELQRGNGTGLGLHITKDIIEQHKGVIKAVSDGLNKGTTFSITLPMYHIQEWDKKATRNRGKLGSERHLDISGLSKCESLPLRILIVDDASTNRKLVRRLLERQGHQCDEAENGAIAYDMVVDSMKENDHVYDTILMDNDMPVMSGPSSVKKMRDNGCRSLIIGITGNVLPDAVDHFIKCGANSVLSKPFDMSCLLKLWKENGLCRQNRKPTKKSEGSFLPKSEEKTENHSVAKITSVRLPLHILLVDDAVTNRKLLRRLLEKNGHTCEEAENGDIAYNLVVESMKKANQQFDSILIDNEMPIMSGPTAVKKMRAYGCVSLIIGITGNVLPEDVAHFKQCGADSVLPKPFVFDDLISLWAECGLFR
jgi:CheY-like chemotaxis protein